MIYARVRLLPERDIGIIFAYSFLNFWQISKILDTQPSLLKIKARRIRMLNVVFFYVMI